MRDDAGKALQEVMRVYARIAPEPPDVAEPPTVAGVAAARRRVWTAARAFTAGFVAVFAVGIITLVVAVTGDAPDAAGPDLQPIELGDSYIWPAQPSDASPEQLAAAFAEQVLGWNDATVERAPDSDPNGPVWVRIGRAGRESVNVLTAPFGAGGRVLHQIGDPASIRSAVPGETGGSVIGLATFPGAVGAEVTARVAGNEREVVIAAGAADIAAGSATTTEIPDPTAILTLVVRYLDAAGEVVAVSGGEYGGESLVADPAAPVTDESTDLPYRLLVDRADAGETYVTAVAAGDEEFESLWNRLNLGGDLPSIDFTSSVVFYFGAAESSSCPLGSMRGLVYLPGEQRIYPDLPVDIPAGSTTCTSDARPHAVLVAVARRDLPAGPFSLWIDRSEDLPACCEDGATFVAPGELTIHRGATYPPLGGDGVLGVGETRIAYGVGTHCGVEWLGVSINGQVWRAIDLDRTGAGGVDPVPRAWGEANDNIDLRVTLRDESTLQATAVGTDVTVTYTPDPDFPGCA